MFPPEVYTLISSTLAILSIYGFFSAKTTKTETRITTVEIELRSVKDELMECQKRLDRHDDHYKAILIMGEQIKSLTSTVNELKDKIDKLS